MLKIEKRNLYTDLYDKAIETIVRCDPECEMVFYKKINNTSTDIDSDSNSKYIATILILTILLYYVFHARIGMIINNDIVDDN